MSNVKSSLSSDVKSGFLVFLIALPLSLGIAMASGFPPVAGVLTAMIGGIVVTFLGGSRLTIKGPAAGLIVIALGAVQELGEGDLTVGYKRALAVGVMAAGVQIIFALMRAASVGVAMSPSVVHGMLAAIGVIIISKQVHVAVGVQPEGKEPLELLAEIPHSLTHANPEILLIGGISLLILFLFPLIKYKAFKAIPPPVVVLAVAIPLGLFLDMDHAHEYVIASHHYHIGPEYLVSLPGNLINAIAFPDFSMALTGTSLKYVVMFALVGTIESTLSVLAVDSMDPEKKASDLNRDLLGVSIGNLVSASVGGLPMISEIVRSKANIDAGAKSKYSNFFHGVFLLLFVTFLPGLLHEIPLAALAAMLVYTGARLASPMEILHVKHIGKDQLLLFSTTMIITLVEDLLVGVAVGILLKLVLHLIRGAKLGSLFNTKLEKEQKGDVLELKLHGTATFTNLLRVKKELLKVSNETTKVLIDLSDVKLVDHTFLMRLEGFADEWPNAVLELEGLNEMQATSAHKHASRRAA